MTEREQEADGDGPLAVLHELSRDIVDGGDVIGVHGVAEAEAVSKKRGAKKHGIAVKRDGSPKPRAEVENGEKDVDADDATAQICGRIVEQRLESVQHRGAQEKHE